jgi:AcrR family transcriptional regulator
VAGDTRERMVMAAVELLQRHGVSGMSFTDVLHHSGAARGAIYHHFPGGKAQLVAEAAARNGTDVQAHLAALPATSPLTVVEAFIDTVRPVVAASATGCGCAIAAITVSRDADSDGLRDVAATTFTTWGRALAERLSVAGVEPADALNLATSLIAILEGAQVLCRAAGTVEPFEQAARTLTALIDCRYPPST